MTNPTLERAARALFDSEAQDNYDGSQLTWEQANEEYRAHVRNQVRAVLMAVLPTLERYEIAEDSNQFFGYREFSHKEGEYVHYEDLQAILNDGEGE